jgi:nitrite reductase/ring-hydroxylating ferredoxin subunit
MTLLCRVDEIPEGQSKGFDLDGFKCFAVHKDGQFFVYQNRCPHLGVELEWMPDTFLDSEGCLIQCSMHGALFNIEDGDCIAGPCVGEQLIALPFKIEQGQLILEQLPE